jgi:hypothetical protein
MRLGRLLAHLDHLEVVLAGTLRAAADRHAGEHDVFHQCQTFAVTAVTRAQKLEPLADQYPGDAEWTPAVQGQRDDLLEDLLLLHLQSHEVAIAWEMAAQGAKAARDERLLALATECHAETEMQAKWFETRIKTTAPQALVVE